jgi:hypothetical protein
MRSLQRNGRSSHLSGPRLIYTVLVLIPLACGQEGGPREGVVRSEDGRPLERVWVQELGARRGELTKANGRFQFARGSTLLFYAHGFRPQVRAVPTADEAMMQVIMAQETAPAAGFRSCRREKPGMIRRLRPQLLDRMHITSCNDADYSSHDITYNYGKKCYLLQSMTGIHVAPLAPSGEWVSDLSSFSVEGRSCGSDRWFDLRGTTPDGLVSRWLAYPFSYIEYSKVPKAVAEVFDRALENGCCL